MDNYKFRAWDDVLLRYFSPMTIKEIGMSNMNNTNWYQLTLEQWTGLCDKNGVEIYVGDKLRISNNATDCDGIVVYSNKYASFVFKETKSIKFEDENIGDYDGLEVIGHIHEGRII